MRKSSTRSIPGAPSAAPHLPAHALTRRAFAAGLPLLLGGCMVTDYGGVQDGGFTIAPVNVTAMDPSLARQEVAWNGREKP
jgi:hypothetical protein